MGETDRRDTNTLSHTRVFLPVKLETWMRKDEAETEAVYTCVHVDRENLEQPKVKIPEEVPHTQREHFDILSLRFGIRHQHHTSEFLSILAVRTFRARVGGEVNGRRLAGFRGERRKW